VHRSSSPSRRLAPFCPDGIYAEVCPLASWPVGPSSSIVCDGDRTIRPDWSIQAARSMLGTDAIRFPGGHCPQVARPGALADVLVGQGTSV
jgi:hypothetical protein